MKQFAGDAVEIRSAGTRTGTALDDLSVESLRELGIDVSEQRPAAPREEMVRRADVVVRLGREADVDRVDGTRSENWDADEPSERGVEGMERTRLVRDDIARRVRNLAKELGVPGKPGPTLRQTGSRVQVRRPR